MGKGEGGKRELTFSARCFDSSWFLALLLGRKVQLRLETLLPLTLGLLP